MGLGYCLVVVLSLIPVVGLFTTTRVFFVRDLSLFFWSRHLWLRQTISGGEAPWWDPYVAGGQAAIADALNQLLMPVTMALRLLPSDVVSFNLWIALPLPVAALGTFLFLRRRQLPAPAAALGAYAFALSGPVVSMLNTPNLSWSVALMPWVLAAIESRGGSRLRDKAASAGQGREARFPLPVSVSFALQGLCGEPVTWVSTGLMAVGYSFFRLKAEATRSKEEESIASSPTSAASASLASTPVVSASLTSTPVVSASLPLNPVASAFRRKTPFRPTIHVIGALAAGALLAAAQLVPTMMAGLRAGRSALATPDFWSLHPVALWETIAPGLFGNYFDASLADLPWMGALNFGRDPFFYSLYVGPLVLLLAGIGLASRFHRNVFWLVVALVFLTAALGGYTPLYPLARKLFPPLLYFRFPVKYLVITVFACAVLAAEGFSSLPPRKGGRIAIAAGVGLVLALILLVMPDLAARAARAMAEGAQLRDPAAGAAFVVRTAPWLLVRACALLFAAGLLIAAAPRVRLAGVALFMATCVDLLLTNGGLNPTTQAAKLAPPSWYRESAGGPRVYIGGRVRGFMNTNDPDAVSAWQLPAGRTALEQRMALNAQLPLAPSGWRVREALSYDLPHLWPSEYEAALRRFEQAGTVERAAFLRRSGVRRCVLPLTESRQFRVAAEVPDWNMRVFECNPGASRVVIAPSVEAAPDPPDLAWQREALFDPALPDNVARVEKLPAVSGTPGPPEEPMARIVRDEGTVVVVEASGRQAGTLILRDSYDESWTASIDGLAAEIARVNGLYRAVALPPGRHVIRFSYRPRDLMAGLIISGMTAGLLALVAFSRSRQTGRREQGFTLIELMIVLAIVAVLLAIAFNEYRGMQARGNDASALSSIRAIAAAQWQFAMTCGNTKYASTLPALAQPVPSTGQGFLSPDLTSSAEPFEKSGYMFQMTATPLENAAPACNGASTAEGYAVTADPVKPGATGVHFYGVNADRVIYQDEAESFTGNLPESGAPKHGTEVK